jgi:hypothetical protein
MAMVKRRELRRMVETMTPREFSGTLREALEKKELKAEDFSIRDLFEATVPDGQEIVRMFDPRESNSMDLLEAGAVDTSLFKNVSGQILFSAVLEGYNNPILIWPQLCRVVSTKFDGEKIPGVSGLGDQATTIMEGKPYPEASLSEQWIETPSTTKRGIIVSITKEAIFFDRTGILVDRCNKVGETLALKKEKEVIDLALGKTNNYKWKGNSVNTYANSSGYHNWDNLVTSNGLTTYANIDTALQAFSAITDPGTGEPILVNPTTILLGTSKRAQALAVLNAIQVRYDTNANLATPTTQTYFSTQSIVQGPYTVLTNGMVDARMTAGSVTASDWFFGDPKKAFAWMENWPITVVQAASGGDAEFERDIVARYKASERGVGAVMDPRWMQQNQA